MWDRGGESFWLAWFVSSSFSRGVGWDQSEARFGGGVAGRGGLNRAERVCADRGGFQY